MKRIGVSAVAFLAAAFCTSTAAAQICASFPTLDRQFSFGASLGFPDGGDLYGVEASYNVQGPFAVFGGLDIASPDGDGDSLDTYYAGGAFDLFKLGLGAGGDSLSVCPSVQVGYASFDGGSDLVVPIGLGFGTSLSLTPSAQLMPYVIPQLVMNRWSFDDFDAESEWDFAVSGGALVGFGMFYLGAQVEHSFREGADPVFGLRVGVRP